ncbi:MAG: AAA family ATPase [Porticoccaceae bacterium]|nr:AAA family ATPase [Porticoccaceae bacterium]
MIKTLFTGNFKAFAETQHIPIRPITLIFGPNSAGKSSFIHSLALASEAERTGRLDIFKTEVGGSAIDLGGFRQYIHRAEAKRRMEWGAELDVSTLHGRLAELLATVQTLKIVLTIGVELDNEERPLPGAEPAVSSYELLGDEQLLLRMSRRRDGRLRLDRLNHSHTVFREVLKAIVTTATTTETITDKDFEGIGDVIDEMVPELSTHVARLFPEGLIFRADGSGDAEQPALFPVSKGNRNEDLANAINFFFPRMLDELIKGSSHVLAQELKKFIYLGPLRSFPPRHLAFSEHEDANWYAGGGYAWDVVRRDDNVRHAVNRWLGSDVLRTPYELKVRKLIAPEQEGEALERWIQGVVQAFDWIRERSGELSEEGFEIIESLGFVDNNYEHETQEGSHDPWSEWDADIAVRLMKSALANAGEISELILFDLRNSTPVTHRDVGIGITQVLPVLVMAYASKNKLIAMEQPEIHLHPALQAELADVFIEAATGEQKNRFILETHSEHLILRILRRIREGRLRPEDIAVLYVEPLPGRGSRILDLRVDEDGDFIDKWPGGFFEESYHEKFAGR